VQADLRDVLCDQSEFVAVGENVTRAEAVAMTTWLQQHVVLMHLHMPDKVEEVAHDTHQLHAHPGGPYHTQVRTLGARVVLR